MTTINIGEINFHFLTSEAKRSGGVPLFECPAELSHFLGPTLSGGDERGDGDGAAAQAAEKATAAEAQASEAKPDSELTLGEIVDFLGTNSEYKLRTMEAIVRNFPGRAVQLVKAIVERGVFEGSIVTRRRLRDGATLYGCAALV